MDYDKIDLVKCNVAVAKYKVAYECDSGISGLLKRGVIECDSFESALKNAIDKKESSKKSVEVFKVTGNSIRSICFLHGHY